MRSKRASRSAMAARLSLRRNSPCHADERKAGEMLADAAISGRSRNPTAYSGLEGSSPRTDAPPSTDVVPRRTTEPPLIPGPLIHEKAFLDLRDQRPLCTNLQVVRIYEPAQTLLGLWLFLLRRDSSCGKKCHDRAGPSMHRALGFRFQHPCLIGPDRTGHRSAPDQGILMAQATCRACSTFSFSRACLTTSIISVT